MIKKLSTTLFILLCGIPVFAQNSTETEIKSFLDQLKDEDFSGTILVAKNDTIIEERTYGFASIEFDVENTIDTKFNAASITKSFTAVAILQLYEQGKIDLHQPIGAYLKGYPNERIRNSVTAHQLLTHTAGTPNFYITNFLDKNKFQYKTVEDFVPLFVEDTLLFEPGTEYHYDAAGYVLLGLIIEQLSGKTYYEFLEENIFTPAQMTNTAAFEIDAIVKNKATGYTFKENSSAELKKNTNYLSYASPGGFHYSTVRDLFNFSRALMNYKLLKKETVDLMIKPKVKGYNTFLGYGIDVDERYPEIILGHSGGFYGMSGEYFYFPDSGYTVTILSNVDTEIDSGTSMVSGFFKTLIAGKMEEQ